MPSSTASRSRALTVSAPAWWPSATVLPCCCAQRPLPSVMIATWRAGTPASDFEDLGLFGLQRAVDLADLLVGQLLQRLLGAVLVVGPRLAGLAQLAQVVHD